MQRAYQVRGCPCGSRHRGRRRESTGGGGSGGLAETLAGCGGGRPDGDWGVWGWWWSTGHRAHAGADPSAPRRDAMHSYCERGIEDGSGRAETARANASQRERRDRETIGVLGTSWGQLLVGLKRKKWAKLRIVQAHSQLVQASFRPTYSSDSLSRPSHAHRAPPPLAVPSSLSPPAASLPHRPPATSHRRSAARHIRSGAPKKVAGERRELQLQGRWGGRRRRSSSGTGRSSAATT